MMKVIIFGASGMVGQGARQGYAFWMPVEINRLALPSAS